MRPHSKERKKRKKENNDKIIKILYDTLLQAIIFCKKM